MQEPNIRSAFINITYMTDDRSLFQEGYYFFAPFALGEGGSGGPHMFDQEGV